MELISYDWNCPQYITPRFTAAEVEKYAAPLKARIAELEAQLAARDGPGIRGIDDKEVQAVPPWESTPTTTNQHRQLRK
jgi:hypothetical protein